jgi:HK97 gp10 family phage protein
MVTRIRITKMTDGDEIARQIVPRMESLGQAVGARMQRLVPKRTWALHDTIETATERRGAKVTTTISAGSADVGYALLVERGTSRMRAQPYMRPALAQSRAGDLHFSGKGILRHGVRTVSTRRTRVKSQGTR